MKKTNVLYVFSKHYTLEIRLVGSTRNEAKETNCEESLSSTIQLILIKAS